ncbi:hypothetical protein BKA64DRAFT_684960, partial [Cadophora sp. MPI-SDFR-AT-0126]
MLLSGHLLLAMVFLLVTSSRAMSSPYLSFSSFFATTYAQLRTFKSSFGSYLFLEGRYRDRSGSVPTVRNQNLNPLSMMLKNRDKAERRKTKGRQIVSV